VNKAGCQIEYLFPEFQPINENKTSDFMETLDHKVGSLNNFESEKMPDEEPNPTFNSGAINSDHTKLNHEEAFFRRKTKKSSFYSRFKDSE